MSSLMKKASSFFGISDVVDEDEELDMEEDTNADYDENSSLLSLSPSLQSHDEPDQGHFGSQLSRIVTIRPESYEDAEKVGRAIRSGVPVVLNLASVNTSTARRILDFSMGVVYGLNGAVERVDKSVFLLSPSQVAIRDGKSSLSHSPHDIFS